MKKLGKILINNMTIKQKIMPAGICSLIVSIITMGLITYHYETKLFEDSFKDFAHSQSLIFSNRLAEEANNLAGIQCGLARVESMLRIFSARNRKKLHSVSPF